MITLFNTKLREIDAVLASAQPADIPDLFREIPLDIFGELLLEAPPRFPNIKRFLPSMPSKDVQLHWTGAYGEGLQAQSVAFVRSLVFGFTDLSGESLKKAKILDFGCGWGRLIRLLYKYTSYQNIYGVDPWEGPIKECRDHGIKAHLALSDSVPHSLPFACAFDLIFAFSVFTHLSEKTMRVALGTLRNYISANGVLAITIRPVEYWRYHKNGAMASQMVRAHEEKGFAFAASASAPIDGDVTFGDTSISIEYLKRNLPQWDLVSIDYNLIDSYQVILFLKPV